MLSDLAEQGTGIVVATHDGTPVRIRDLGRVEVGHEIRRGAVTADGQGGRCTVCISRRMDPE